VEEKEADQTERLGGKQKKDAGLSKNTTTTEVKRGYWAKRRLALVKAGKREGKIKIHDSNEGLRWRKRRTRNKNIRIISKEKC